MTQLAPHQQRVVDEKRELDEKLQKLSAFISSKDFTTFVQNEAERGRLICQEETMRDYSAILAERIEAFGAVSITIPVIDPGPDSLEREIQAKASKGPRVTPADVEAEIAAEFYFTAADGVLGQSEMGTRPAAWTNLDQVTICTLVLRNGAKVLGVNYGAIDRTQHDAGKGREAARAEAVEKIWELLGFRLRDELARPVLTEADALADLAGEPRPT